jgi:SAM-dependent methyltransferase
MSLSAVTSTPQDDLISSEKAGQTVAEWWEMQHERRDPGWLSSTDPTQVWSRLGVLDKLKAGSVVLNIGVGVGAEARDLDARGCQVHCLDISQRALEGVRNIATIWRTDELNALPADTFDLACSHLVVQHMTDDDLAAQMQSVIRALKPDGIFALQFAYLIKDPEYRNPPSRPSVKGGGVLYSPNRIAEIAMKAGGRVVWLQPSDEFPELGSMWHASQIARCLVSGSSR